MLPQLSIEIEYISRINSVFFQSLLDAIISQLDRVMEAFPVSCRS